jgi:3-deoxy-D-manno-octulosonate 8-phosphate phosphatase KdsC-like HAD superfamily phosphatase
MNESTLCEKLKKIKLLTMDVDGNNDKQHSLLLKNGRRTKTILYSDGMGIELLRREGIKTA